MFYLCCDDSYSRDHLPAIIPRVVKVCACFWSLTENICAMQSPSQQTSDAAVSAEHEHARQEQFALHLAEELMGKDISPAAHGSAGSPTLRQLYIKHVPSTASRSSANSPYPLPADTVPIQPFCQVIANAQRKTTAPIQPARVERRTSEEKLFAEQIRKLTDDGNAIDCLEKYRDLMVRRSKLAELTEKLIRADSRDADTIAEGERQINALKRKLETYKKDHRRAPAAAQVDQAVAERGVLLANENGWGERYAEILTKLRDHAAKRRFMQARKNVLFQCVTQAFEDTLMDPDGDFVGRGQDPPMAQELEQIVQRPDVGHDPDEDPPMAQEPEQIVQGAHVGQGAIPQELAVNANDLCLCQIILRSGNIR